MPPTDWAWVSASAAPMFLRIGAVQRWFVRRRGFASGLAVSGIGVGTLADAATGLVLNRSPGMARAYLVLGILAAAVGGGLALMIENDPRDRGLGPDGDPPRSGTPTGAAGRESSE